MDICVCVYVFFFLKWQYLFKKNSAVLQKSEKRLLVILQAG